MNKSALRFTTGHYAHESRQVLESDSVYVETPDGRLMFEIKLGADSSVTVRGAECCIVNGTLYSEELFVKPHADNCVSVRVLEYEKRLT